mgnify:CR=1 FL=1
MQEPNNKLLFILDDIKSTLRRLDNNLNRLEERLRSQEQFNERIKMLGLIISMIFGLLGGLLMHYITRRS